MSHLRLIHDVDEPEIFRKYFNTVPIDVAAAISAEQFNEESSMADITREEMDAKLQLVEARMDARLARMEAVVENIGKDVAEIKTANIGMRRFMLGTAAASVLAIIVGFFVAVQLTLQGVAIGQQMPAPQSAQTGPAEAPRAP
jgi:hypothetical protein